MAEKIPIISNETEEWTADNLARYLGLVPNTKSNGSGPRFIFSDKGAIVQTILSVLAQLGIVTFEERKSNIILPEMRFKK